MKSKILLLLVFTALMLNLHGQGKNFKRIFIEAEYYLLEDDYASALPLYENLLSTDPDNANLNFLCGYCSMKLGGDVNKIITLFEKAI